MGKKDRRLSGIDPLAYTGVYAESPPNVISNDRPPTTTDRKSFNIGDFWIDRSTNDTWYLAAVSGGSANWIKFGTPSTTLITFVTDSGSATQLAGVMNILGGSVVDTSASGNTVTLALTNGANGQVIIGSTATIPAWANITSTGTTITITNGANSINLESAGGATVLTQIDADGGSATPTAGEIIVTGGTNLNTSATGSTLTVNVDDSITISGTLTLSGLGAGVMQADAVGLVFSDNGTNGQVLIGSSSSAPAWANLTSSGATVTITEGANTINIEASGGGTGGVGAAGFFACQETDGGRPPLHIIPIDTSYRYLGAAITLTEVYDNGANLYPGDGAGSSAVFTAPIDGKYFLSIRAVIYSPIYSAGWGDIWVGVVIETTKRIYYAYHNKTHGRSSYFQESRDHAVIADMDAGDTAEFGVQGYRPLAKNFVILGGAASKPITWICGYLIA